MLFVQEKVVVHRVEDKFQFIIFLVLYCMLEAMVLLHLDLDTEVPRHSLEVVEVVKSN